MPARVVFRPNAEADLDGIYDHIARDSRKNAIEFTRRIREQCNRLSDFPFRGTRRDDLEPGLRTIGMEHRVTIAFRVLDQDFVEILRIVYGGRELERMFGA